MSQEVKNHPIVITPELESSLSTLLSKSDMEELETIKNDYQEYLSYLMLCIDGTLDIDYNPTEEWYILDDLYYKILELN